MSQISIDDIKTQNYSAQDFQDALEASFNGKYFTLAKYNKNIYYGLRTFIERYNKDHQDSPTSIDEITLLLTGRHYTTNSEEYVLAKLRSSMDKDGRIESLDQETRVWLKNKHKALKKMGKINTDHVDITEVLAIVLPGAIYMAQKQRNEQSHSAMVAKLKELKTPDGLLDFAGNADVRAHFQTRAKAHGVSIEEEIRRCGFSDFAGVIVHNAPIPVEEHIKNLLECANQHHEIVNLSKYHLETYDYVKKFARKNRCSMAVAINTLLGDKLQSYSYIGIHNKLSKYRIDDSSFIARDPELGAKMRDYILQNMDSSGLVSGLHKSSAATYKVLCAIKEYNDLTMQEVLQLFVPSARYEEREFPRVHTRETIGKKLKLYDDGTGCIDAARKNKSLMSSLRRLCQKNGTTMDEEIELAGGFYFTDMLFEVDYIDYVKSLLKKYYGENGNVNGISRDHIELYDAVNRIKDFFPGGALASMEDTFAVLGYSIDGVRRESKFTEEYVRALLERTFGDQRSISELGSHQDVMCALLTLSGKMGTTIKETLAHFGFEHSSGKDELERLRRIKLSREERQRLSKGDPSEPGGED